MKKSLVFGVLVFLLITNIIFISITVAYKTKVDKQIFKVYSFEGEDPDIKISDGLVILSPNKQIVNGGKIQYIGNTQKDIQYYSKTIYIDNQGDKDIVLSNSVSFTGDNVETAFPNEFLLNKDIGEIASERLFTEDAMNIIKDNLYFSLDYSTVHGQTGKITMRLKVKEFNMNETK